MHPNPLGDGEVGLSHLSESSYRRDLGQLGFWVGTGILSEGDFF